MCVIIFISKFLTSKIVLLTKKNNQISLWTRNKYAINSFLSIHTLSTASRHRQRCSCVGTPWTRSAPTLCDEWNYQCSSLYFFGQPFHLFLNLSTPFSHLFQTFLLDADLFKYRMPIWPMSALFFEQLAVERSRVQQVRYRHQTIQTSTHTIATATTTSSHRRDTQLNLTLLRLISKIRSIVCLIGWG